MISCQSSEVLPSGPVAVAVTGAPASIGVGSRTLNEALPEAVGRDLRRADVLLGLERSPRQPAARRVGVEVEIEQGRREAVERADDARAAALEGGRRDEREVLEVVPELDRGAVGVARGRWGSGPPGVLLLPRSMASPMPFASTPPRPLLKIRLPRIGFSCAKSVTRMPTQPLKAMTLAWPAPMPPIGLGMRAQEDAHDAVAEVLRRRGVGSDEVARRAERAEASRKMPYPKPPITLPSPAPLPPTVLHAGPVDLMPLVPLEIVPPAPRRPR